MEIQLPSTPNPPKIATFHFSVIPANKAPKLNWETYFICKREVLSLPQKNLRGAISSQLPLVSQRCSLGRLYRGAMVPADNVRGSALLSNFWKSPRLNDNAFPLNSKLLLFFFFLKHSPAISFYCVQAILWRKWDKYSPIRPCKSRGGGAVS